MSRQDADSASLVLHWLKLTSRTGTRWYRFSRLRRTLDRFTHVVRESRTAGWLTAEPDPDVIVIDLTETKTVGPFIALLDRLVPNATRAWNNSILQTGLTRTVTRFRTAPVQLASVFILAVVLAQFTRTWSSASPTSLALLCFVAVPALLGIRVTWTWDELVESRVGRLTTAILAPPEPPREEPPDEET